MFEIDVEEVEYLRHGEKPYFARVYKPRGRGPFPAVVEAHGGAWVQGNRAGNDAINCRVAKGGVVVAALDFRCPPEGTYPASVADVNFGVRWLKANAAQFSTAAGMVGLMGTSSGGHLAVLAAIKPDEPRYAAIAGPAHVNARVPFVVAMWPVICPLGRYVDNRAHLGSNPADAHNLQMKYWLTEEAMADGSPNLALQRGDKAELPDILYLQHPVDPLHPRAYLESFVAGYRAAGGNVQLEWFEGRTYDALRSDPEAEASRAAIGKIIEFVHRRASTF